MVQWRNHGKHHARVSAREEITLPYVAVPALEEAFAFIIMACELYACIFGFGLWLLAGWHCFYLLTPLFWMRRDMVWWISTWWYGYGSGSDDLWGWKERGFVCMVIERCAGERRWWWVSELNISFNWTNKQTDDERTDELIGIGIRKVGMGISKQIWIWLRSLHCSCTSNSEFMLKRDCDGSSFVLS